jgi:hypothetical protein
MGRTRFAFLAVIVLSATRAAAAPPAASPAGSAIPLKAGDTVRFDLSRLPDALVGEGKALCVGTRIAATGPTEARCEPTFRFEAPAGEMRMVYTFRPAKGGGETPIAIPITRERKPVSFVAPSDGSILSPQPTPFAKGASDGAARRAAEAQCGACQGQGFSLQSFEVTKNPAPPDGSLPVRIEVSSGPARK